MNIQRGSKFKPEKDYYKIAGIILLVGLLQFFTVLNLVETQYPGYSTSINTISELGGSIPLLEPSSTIFNLSLIIMGILTMVAVYFILKSGGCRLFSACLLLFAISIIGIGVFPLYAGEIHSFFTIIAFISGVLAVIFSYRLGLNIPMVILSLVVGFTALITLILTFSWGLGPSNPLIQLLGKGGLQRFIMYPGMLYLIGLGGYLTSRGEDWVRLRFSKGYF
ncbi:DUF998 domain-containing protein [Methanobacterium alkalithermotolerans]|uniref:DUF998 domain-containing protein n=1 Tax=Methanobacterium alkalithermotolerans TaxID=2731220 RepID=A0A8T8K6L3_9EURY|nr:DUF998 domain-containing protein [Methanobacterium alkalithermotolerans]